MEDLRRSALALSALYGSVPFAFNPARGMLESVDVGGGSGGLDEAPAALAGVVGVVQFAREADGALRAVTVAELLGGGGGGGGAGLDLESYLYHPAGAAVFGGVVSLPDAVLAAVRAGLGTPEMLGAASADLPGVGMGARWFAVRSVQYRAGAAFEVVRYENVDGTTYRVEYLGTLPRAVVVRSRFGFAALTVPLPEGNGEAYNDSLGLLMFTLLPQLVASSAAAVVGEVERREVRLGFVPGEASVRLAGRLMYESEQGKLPAGTAAWMVFMPSASDTPLVGVVGREGGPVFDEDMVVQPVLLRWRGANPENVVLLEQVRVRAGGRLPFVPFAGRAGIPTEANVWYAVGLIPQEGGRLPYALGIVDEPPQGMNMWGAFRGPGGQIPDVSGFGTGAPQIGREFLGFAVVTGEMVPSLPGRLPLESLERGSEVAGVVDVLGVPALGAVGEGAVLRAAPGGLYWQELEAPVVPKVYLSTDPGQVSGPRTGSTSTYWYWQEYGHRVTFRTEAEISVEELAVHLPDVPLGGRVAMRLYQSDASGSLGAVVVSGEAAGSGAPGGWVRFTLGVGFTLPEAVYYVLEFTRVPEDGVTGMLSYPVAELTAGQRVGDVTFVSAMYRENGWQASSYRAPVFTLRAGAVTKTVTGPLDPVDFPVVEAAADVRAGGAALLVAGGAPRLVWRGLDGVLWYGAPFTSNP